MVDVNQFRNVTFTGPLVLDPEIYDLIPTAPADCIPGEVSVEVSIQAAGSLSEAFHTFAFNVVGKVPTTCRRIWSASPGIYVPVSAFELKTVSAPPTPLATDIVINPVFDTQMLTR